MSTIAQSLLADGIDQSVFYGAPPEVKSAVMDSKGRIWLVECKKEHLTPNHRSWVSDTETAFYYHNSASDASNWKISAINREGE